MHGTRGAHNQDGISSGDGCSANGGALDVIVFFSELSAAISKSKISSFATSTLIEAGAVLHD